MRLPADSVPARDTRLIWAGLFVSLALFAKLPQLDLWVSGRYFSESGGFFLASHALVQALYKYTPPVGHSLLVLAACIILLTPLLKRWATPNAQLAKLLLLRRTAIASLLVATLSSGVLVDLVLKGVVGRPRPVQVYEFGGMERFQGVFELGDNPQRHKSFVSGHATAGFSLMSIGLMAGAAWRRRWFLIGLVCGSLIGMGRILQGGHFLSDVVFAFYTVWLTCETVAWGMQRFMPGQVPENTPRHQRR